MEEEYEIECDYCEKLTVLNLDEIESGVSYCSESCEKKAHEEEYADYILDQRKDDRIQRE
jgi:hypothetical protein